MKIYRRFLLVMVILLAWNAVFGQQGPSDYDNNWKEFRSSKNFFNLKYPSQWIFYEETPSGYRFSEANITEKGVFRIQEYMHNEDSFNVKSYLEAESQLKPNSSVRYANGNYYLSYTNLVTTESREMLQYVWVIGSGFVVLHCTYTIRNELKSDERIRNEYGQVYRVIENIRFEYH